MYRFVKYWFRAIFLINSFEATKEKAKLMHKQTGKRYYVFLINGHYFVMDNALIKAYNQKEKYQKVTGKKAMETCLYYTPNLNKCE